MPNSYNHWVSNPSLYQSIRNFREAFNIVTLYQNKYRVESVRLAGWDYSSPGYYFITICTKNRECLFGDIVNDKMIQNQYGQFLENCWNDLPNHYPNLKLDQFVIMPNHLHGIMIIANDNNSIGYSDAVLEPGLKPGSTKTSETTNKTHGLFEFVRALKTFTSRQINEHRQTPGISVWPSGFYDHIIRENNELNLIRKYIISNPVNWDNDDNRL